MKGIGKMTLVRLEPFRRFENLGKRINDFANDFEKGISLEVGSFSPKTDICDNEKNIFISAELPGMAKEDIKISVTEDRILSIKGNKHKNNNDKTFLRNERNYGEFERTFVLSGDVDIEHIDAKFDNGVLELVMNKIEPPEPKEINVDIK